MLKAIDSTGNWGTQSISTAAFSTTDSYKAIDRMSADGYAVAYDHLGNLYAAGYGTNSTWIVRKWDGVSWTTVDEYEAQMGSYASPATIYIDSSNHVYVGGSANSSTGSHMTVRKWDGTSWSTMDFFLYNNGADTIGAASVTKILEDSSGNLYAIGYVLDYAHPSPYYDHWIVRKWDGTSWSTMDDYRYPSGSASASDGYLDSSGNLYVIGGGTDVNGDGRWLVRKWDGTSWSTVDDTAVGSPFTITADSSGNLYVAGMYWDGSSIPHVLIRKWDGSSWSDWDDYNYTGGGAGGGYLAAGPSGSLYVGAFGFVSSEVHWLVRKWDGSSWSLMDDYWVPGDVQELVQQVGVDSTGKPVAIGRRIDSSADYWTVRKWNGSSWDILDSYQAELDQGTVPSGAVWSSGNLYVSGYRTTNDSYWTVRKWDGSSWSVSDSYLDPAQSQGFPLGIAADSLGNIYVAGYGFDSNWNFHWMVRDWNGSSWAASDDYYYDSSQNGAQATAITVDTSGNVYVAGTGTDTSWVDHWIVRKWDGSSWNTIDDYEYDSSNSGAHAWAISVDSSGNLYVAGYAADSASHQHWIVRKWNGTAWSVSDDFQYVATKTHFPAGIASDSSGNVYVVGQVQDNSNKTHWLVRKWDGASWGTMDDFQLSPGHNANATSAAVDSSGNLYVAGAATNSAGTMLWTVRKWNSYSWSTTESYTANSNPIFTSLAWGLAVSPSGAVSVVGQTNDFTGTHWTVRQQ